MIRVREEGKKWVEQFMTYGRLRVREDRQEMGSAIYDCFGVLCFEGTRFVCFVLFLFLFCFEEKGVILCDIDVYVSCCFA